MQDSFLKPDISITRRPPPNEKCDFSTTEVVVEGKCIPQDIFRDPAEPDTHPEKPFAKEDDASVIARGQLTAAVRHIFLHQHRSSVFSVFLSQERARFIYTDRSAAAVTDSIEWRTEIGLRKFVKFFETLHQSDRAQRGHDVTVSGVEDGRKERYNEWAELNAEPLTRFFGTERNDRRVLQFIGENDNEYLCDAMPIHASKSLLGRASRCFVGMDVVSGKMVLIKDQWRIQADDLVAEWETYEKLKAVKRLDQYLLTVNEGRDIPEQSTKLWKYDKPPFRRPVDCQSWIEDVDTVIRHQIQTHIHHRIVFGTVGNRVLDCTSSKMFLRIMRDVVEGWKGND
jgi:Fungal protein kinase